MVRLNCIIFIQPYFFLKKLGQSDEKAFGLDKSDVVKEHIPLLYHPISTNNLKRLQ